MTDQAQELRKWSAEFMGWHLVDEWQPLKDMNQCFQVVDRMRELGWQLFLDNDTRSKEWEAEFIHEKGSEPYKASSTNPGLAILLAAKATEVK